MQETRYALCSFFVLVHIHGFLCTRTYERLYRELSRVSRRTRQAILPFLDRDNPNHVWILWTTYIYVSTVIYDIEILSEDDTCVLVNVLSFVEPIILYSSTILCWFVLFHFSFFFFVTSIIFCLFPGLLCHLDDACTSNPCHQGAICDTSPINGSFTCSCASGYKGLNCSEDINECEQGKFDIEFHSLGMNRA